MLIRFIALFAVSHAAFADDSAIEQVKQSSRIWVPAKSVELKAPRYPRTELRNGRQAWVEVSYCIDESGVPRNVSVLDSVGNLRFEQAAVSSVEKWRYEPALVDGKPSWQSGNSKYITFAIEGGNKGANRKFIRQFRQLGELIMNEDIAAADKLFWEMYDSDKLSLYELAKLWAQRVRYEAIGGDMYRLHMALTRATASDGEWIDKKDYVRLLALRIKVEVQLEQYPSVLRSYRKLIEATGDDAKEVMDFQPMIAEIRKMIASDNILKVSAEVRKKDDCSFCNDSWYFIPARNSFTFANIDGELSSIDMRCRHKRFESKVGDQVEWNIPDEWGNCKIQVYGEPGTTMDVLYLPSVDDDQPTS